MNGWKEWDGRNGTGRDGMNGVRMQMHCNIGWGMEEEGTREEGKNTNI